MKNCYESFLRWLCLWLPCDTTLHDHLCDSTYYGLDGEFWEAIAPENEDTTPWVNFSHSKTEDEFLSGMTQEDMFDYYFDPNDPYAFD